MTVQGSFDKTFRLLWAMDVTEAMRRYWNDPEETAEQGAFALALLLLRSLAGLTVLERSRKGTGFDWWLAAEDNLFQAAGRLEVSGIMRGSAKRINQRLREQDKSNGALGQVWPNRLRCCDRVRSTQSQGGTAMNVMNQTKELHHRAMQLADQASQLRRSGEEKEATARLREASSTSGGLRNWSLRTWPWSRPVRSCTAVLQPSHGSVVNIVKPNGSSPPLSQVRRRRRSPKNCATCSSRSISSNRRARNGVFYRLLPSQDHRTAERTTHSKVAWCLE